MYGDKAAALLRLLRMSREKLPAYQDRQIKAIVDEINALKEESEKLLDNMNNYVAPAFVVQNESMMRNKRCLLAYLMYRLKYLQRIRWELGATLDDPSYAIEQHLSPEEKRFFRDYDALLSEYMEKGCRELDLTGDCSPPRGNLMVEVRVMKDVGEVLLEESGRVNLKKNTTHFVWREEADHLIKQGVVQQIDAGAVDH